MSLQQYQANIFQNIRQTQAHYINYNMILYTKFLLSKDESCWSSHLFIFRNLELRKNKMKNKVILTEKNVLIFTVKFF